MRLKDDPTITRIRATRHRISQRCGHSPQKMVEYYIELQKKYQDRLLIELEQAEARDETFIATSAPDAAIARVN